MQPLEVLCTKGVFKNFADFTRKQLSLSLFLIKACNVIKKRLQHWCFPVKFLKFLKAPSFKNIYVGLIFEGGKTLNIREIPYIKSTRDRKNDNNNNQNYSL